MLYDTYKISNYESCRNLEDIEGTTVSSMKCVIPKYMSNMLIGPRESKVPINRNIFANAPDCAVSPPITVTQQGYLTIKKYKNEVLDFTSKCLRRPNGRYYIPKDTTFMCEVVYEDPLTAKITGKV